MLRSWISLRGQLKSPHPSWTLEIIIRLYTEKLHKCCQDLQPSRTPDVCCDSDKHSRSFHHRLPALLYFENQKRTTWYLNLNIPMCSHSVWCTALCFTEATDTGEVLSFTNAINTRKQPISSAAFTFSTPGLEKIILWLQLCHSCCSG